MKIFECCFELPRKGLYMEVVNNPEYDNVCFAMYEDCQFLTSVCIRENEVDELIAYLQLFKEQTRTLRL
jgi:hypothetical protein